MIVDFMFLEFPMRVHHLHHFLPPFSPSNSSCILPAASHTHTSCSSVIIATDTCTCLQTQPAECVQGCSYVYGFRASCLACYKLSGSLSLEKSYSPSQQPSFACNCSSRGGALGQFLQLYRNVNQNAVVIFQVLFMQVYY